MFYEDKHHKQTGPHPTVMWVQYYCLKCTCMFAPKQPERKGRVSVIPQTQTGMHVPKCHHCNAMEVFALENEMKAILQIFQNGFEISLWHVSLFLGYLSSIRQVTILSLSHYACIFYTYAVTQSGNQTQTDVIEKKTLLLRKTSQKHGHQHICSAVF